MTSVICPRFLWRAFPLSTEMGLVNKLIHKVNQSFVKGSWLKEIREVHLVTIKIKLDLKFGVCL